MPAGEEGSRAWNVFSAVEGAFSTEGGCDGGSGGAAGAPSSGGTGAGGFGAGDFSAVVGSGSGDGLGGNSEAARGRAESGAGGGGMGEVAGLRRAGLLAMAADEFELVHPSQPFSFPGLFLERYLKTRRLTRRIGGVLGRGKRIRPAASSLAVLRQMTLCERREGGAPRIGVISGRRGVSGRFPWKAKPRGAPRSTPDPGRPEGRS